jgi:hypothetical protein
MEQWGGQVHEYLDGMIKELSAAGYRVIPPAEEARMDRMPEPEETPDIVIVADRPAEAAEMLNAIEEFGHF